MVTPAKKLEDLIHLAELCVDLLQQNEEHYAEVIMENTDQSRLQKAKFQSKIEFDEFEEGIDRRYLVLYSL